MSLAAGAGTFWTKQEKEVGHHEHCQRRQLYQIAPFPAGVPQSLIGVPRLVVAGQQPPEQLGRHVRVDEVDSAVAEQDVPPGPGMVSGKGWL